MWQKLMRTWLIGAAVTLAAPEGAMRAETNGPVDKTAESDAGGRLFSAYAGEPMLGELLADPICQALMQRDGVTLDSLTAQIASLQSRRSDQQNPEDG